MILLSFYSTENDIDGEAFLLLKDEDIVELVPSIGARRKLIQKRDDIIKVCGHSLLAAIDSAL